MTEQVSIPDLEADFLALNEALLKVLNSVINRGDTPASDDFVVEFKTRRKSIEEKLLNMSQNPDIGHSVKKMIADMKGLKTRLKNMQKAIDEDIDKTVCEKKENFKNLCNMSDRFLNKIQ